MRRFLRAAAAALAILCAAPPPAGAVITSTSTKTVAACNGVTTGFNFSFVGVNAADIVVTLTDSSGTSTVLTTGTQYAITFNSPPSNQVWGVGGTVTYPVSGSPCPIGSTLTVARNVPFIQTTPFSTLGPFLPTGTETAVDLLTMQVQQLNTLFTGALVQPLTDTQAFSALPAAAARANLALCFDSTGYVPTACSVPSAGTISSAMQPVVSAGSLAAGRTAFGLGSVATESIGAGLQDNGSGSLRVTFPTTQVSTGQAIGTAAHLNQYIATGPINFTLAKTTTLWNGFGFFAKVVTGAVTLVPNAADTIQYGNASSGASVAINPGARVFVTTDGSANWYVYTLGPAPPTQQVLTSGSAATYTTPLGATRLRIRAIGGGGGGGGNGTAGATNGGTGGTTSFNAITAIGGTGGNATNSVTASAGGAGGTGGAGSATRIAGTVGGIGMTVNASYANAIGGFGAGSPFAGSTPGNTTATGSTPVANSGVGGPAAGSVSTAYGSGGGGGSGEYIEFTIANPAATYTYTVGAPGTAGGAGTAGNVAGAGAAGRIIVDEYYDQ